MSRDNRTNTFSTFSDVRQTVGVNYASITVLGKDQVNDGFSGTFYWDAASTIPDDNENVLQKTGVSVGRWVRALTMSGGGGSDDTNFAITDLTATGNRIHNFNNYNLGIYGADWSFGGIGNNFFLRGSSVSGYNALLNTSALSADRNYSFQNKSGVLAHLDDIPQLSAGTGISLSGTFPNVIISSTEQRINLIAGANITLTGIYPNITISSTGGSGGSGTVTSVNATTTGALNVTGGPITSAGTLAFTWTGTGTQYVKGDGTLGVFPTIPTVNDAVLTITPTGIATGGGTFSANSSINKTVNVNVPGTNLTSTIVGDQVTITPSTGTSTTFTLPFIGTVIEIDADVVNGNALSVTGGPITAIGTFNFNWDGLSSQYVGGDGILRTFPTIPSQVSLTAGTGISITGTYPTLTITNTSPNVNQTLSFNTTTRDLTISAGNTVNIPDNNTQYTAGTGINITGTVISATNTNTGTVTSVNVSGSGALTFTGGPITTSGTIAAGWNGSTAQYVRGNGTLATFPTIPAQVNLSAGANISITGTYPNLTIAATGGTDTNFANTNLTFSGNRTHTLGPNSLTITGTNVALDMSGAVGIRSSGSSPQYAYFNTDLLTGFNRFYSFQNKSGTLAHLDDIPTFSAGSGISITGTFPNLTIAASGGGTNTNIANADLTFDANHTANLAGYNWGLNGTRAFAHFEGNPSVTSPTVYSGHIQLEVQGNISPYTTKAGLDLKGSDLSIEGMPYASLYSELSSGGVTYKTEILPFPFPGSFIYARNLENGIETGLFTAVIDKIYFGRTDGSLGLEINANDSEPTSWFSQDHSGIVAYIDDIPNITAGSNVTITGTFPNLVINSGGSGGGGSVSAVTAGAGLTGGTITTTGTVAIGTPTGFTLSGGGGSNTTYGSNSVTGTTHSHSMTFTGTSSQFIRGDGTYGTSIPQVNITAGTGISVTGTYPNIVISSSGGGGTDTNFAITDLTATGNRTHSFGNNSLAIGGTNWLISGSNSFVTIRSNTANAASIAGFNTANITTARTYTFQNKSGILAHLDDIPVLSAGSNVSITGTFPNLTISATGGGGGGGVSIVSAGSLSPLFTTSVANDTTTPAISFTQQAAAANTYFGNSSGASANPSFVANGALTSVNDTNVTLTLSSNASTSLLKNVTATLGWTGALATNRGGTGLTTIGTAGQAIRVNLAGTGLEYYTPSSGTSAVTSVAISGNNAIDFSPSGAQTGAVAFTTTWTGTSSQYVAGNGALVAFPTLPTVNNGTFTVTGSGIATGTGTFSANQSSNSSATINVPGTNLGSSISGSVVTITSTTGTSTSFTLPSGGGNFIENRNASVQPTSNFWISGNGRARTFSLANLTKFIGAPSDARINVIDDTENVAIGMRMGDLYVGSSYSATPIPTNGIRSQGIINGESKVRAGGFGSTGFAQLDEGNGTQAGHLSIYAPSGNRIGFIGYAPTYLNYEAEIGNHVFRAPNTVTGSSTPIVEIQAGGIATLDPVLKVSGTNTNGDYSIVLSKPGSELTSFTVGGAGSFVPETVSTDVGWRALGANFVWGTASEMIQRLNTSTLQYFGNEFRVGKTANGSPTFTVNISGTGTSIESLNNNVAYTPMKFQPNGGDIVLGSGLGSYNINYPRYVGGGNRMLIVDNNGNTQVQAIPGGGGGLTSVVGTPNRVTVNTVGTTATVDIATNYAGQTSINTLGTIGTGTWQGTKIAAGFGGVPPGGTSGQVLTKNSSADNDVIWTTVSGGGNQNLQQTADFGNTTTTDLVLSGANTSLRRPDNTSQLRLAGGSTNANTSGATVNLFGLSVTGGNAGKAIVSAAPVSTGSVDLVTGSNVTRLTIANSGTINVPGFAGTGDRIVTAASNGDLGVGMIISSGTYTPTFSNLSGYTSVTIYGAFKWMRIGNIVTVSGTVNTIGTAITASFDMTLPVLATFSRVKQLTGTGILADSTRSTHNIELVSTGTGANNGRATFVAVPLLTGTYTAAGYPTFSFTYEIV